MTTHMKKVAPGGATPTRKIPPRTVNVTVMVTHAGDVAWYLAMSDERDRHLRLRLAAWREGHAAGVAVGAELRLEAFADGWASGFQAARDQFGRAA